MRNRNVNIKSDFNTFEEGIPNLPFEFVYHNIEAPEAHHYTASFDGETYTNCRRLENGQLKVWFHGHKFHEGQLYCQRSYTIPDTDHPDGKYKSLADAPCGVMMTKDITDGTSAVISVPAFFMQGVPGFNTYELYCRETGYTGTIEEFFALQQQPATDAAAQAGRVITEYIEAAQTTIEHDAAAVRNENNRIATEDNRNTAERQRGTNEQGRTTAEEARTTEEGKRNTAEGLRDIAEKWRSTEEGKRNTAEQARSTEEGKRNTAEGLRDTAEKVRGTNEQGRTTAEQSRSTEEGKRTTAEGLRDTAEKVRGTNEQDRTTAEQARSTEEGKRNTAEGLRDTAEKVRGTNEQGRTTAEQSRSTEEGKRTTAEGLRDTAEKVRGTNEQARTTAEQSRSTEEGKRATAETKRDTAEKARSIDEGKRNTAEQSRSTEEGKRATAETKRDTDEKARAIEEGKRNTAEGLRNTAEQQRTTAAQAHALAAQQQATAFAGFENTINGKADVNLINEVNISAITGQKYADKNAAEAALRQLMSSWGQILPSAVVIPTGYRMAFVDTSDVLGTYQYDGQSWVQDNILTDKEKNAIQQLTQSPDTLWYGVESSLMQASPDMTRIGYMDNHRVLPYHNRIRPCIVKDDRTINYYLDNNDIRLKADGTPAVLDGTDGQLMIYYPAGYHLLNRGLTKEVWAVGLSPFSYDGIAAEYVPAFVVSMDYATVQRTGNKLACVINEDADYAGSGNGATSGGLGYPRTAVSNYNYTLYARNRGAEWVNSFAFFELIKTSLMYIEYSTHYLQKPFNLALTSQGYKQGGLGEGAWNWSGTNWSAYNGYYPVIKIGEVQLDLSQSASTNGTGVYTRVFQIGETQYTTKFPCWRWCSNLYAHLWRWDAGVDIDIHPDTSDTPISVVYMTKNPSEVLATNDNDFSFIELYDKIGELPRVGSYSKEFHKGSAYQKIGSAGSNTYMCAYFWTTIGAGRERRGFRSGGHLNTGGSALRASANSNNRPSITSAYFGSGLSAYVVE